MHVRDETKIENVLRVLGQPESAQGSFTETYRYYTVKFHDDCGDHTGQIQIVGVFSVDQCNYF